MKKYRQEDWWFEERHGWELDSVRDAITWVDDQLISLIAERIRLGWTVARLKSRKGLPIFNPAQEERVVNPQWYNKFHSKGRRKFHS